MDKPYPRFALIFPAITQAAVANTTAGVYTFSRECVAGWVENRTGQPMYVKVGGTVSDPAKTWDWTAVVDNGTRLPISACFLTISIWCPTGATIQLVEPVSGTGSGTATVSIGGWAIAPATQTY